MKRVSVIGISGSGKSTLARAISDRLGLPLLELDGVFNLAGWETKPVDEFRSEVSAFVAGDRWVVDGNYVNQGVAELVWSRADTVVWLDPPKWAVMSRVIRRTLRRLVSREELWNGNREPWTNITSTKPEKNIMVWAWKQFSPVRRTYETMLGDGTWSRVQVVRLQRNREVRSFIEALTA